MIDREGNWELVPAARLSAGDEVIDVGDAERFFQQFKSDYSVMRRLRTVLADTDPVARYTDDAVIRIVASRIESRQLVLKRRKSPSKAQPTQSGESSESTSVWIYSQSTGQLTHGGKEIAQGYSGTASGRNNPGAESLRDLGPIPRGRYTIGSPHNTAKHGPHVMNLTPNGHSALGRSGFLIHGDNKRHDASTGCIILGPDIRNQISNSGDKELEVVP